MVTDKAQVTEGKRRWSLIGAVIAAIVASVCCIGPLVLLILGVSGAWIGNLTVLEPYRPVFVVVTFGFLGLAFYRVYWRPKKEQCEPGSYCANPRAEKINKTVLWIVTVLILGLISFPYIVPYLSAGNTEQRMVQLNKIVLDIENMTCGTCVLTVKKSLTRLEGVKEAQVTLTPPQAVVMYDPGRISTQDLMVATANAGYPSSIVNRGEK